MRTMKLVSVLIAGLVVVCVHVHGSVADAAEDAVLERQAGAQAGEGANNASGGTTAVPAAAAEAGAAAASDAAANPPENTGVETGSDEATSEEASASEEENADGILDDEDPANTKGTQPSLADYIIDMLTHSDNTSTDSDTQQQGEAASAAGGNSTQPQATGAAAAGGDGGGESGAGGSQTPQDGGEASAESAGSSAGQGKNSASSSDTHGDGGADEDKNKDARWKGDGWSSSEEGKPSSSSSSSSTTEAVDCTREVDLRDFCEFTPGALRVFQGDTSLRGLRAAFMDMDIVQNLIACRRGEWCLGDQLDVFKSMQEKIYDSPLCKDSMWECIFDVMMRRENCTEDQEFLFVVDALDLVCSLSGVDAFELQDAEPTAIESRCIAHVQAAVHVSYADFLANGMTEAPMSEQPLCEGYAFRMTGTYLCADDNCKGQYESRQSMEEFRRWNWFLVNSDERVANCPALRNDTCGPLREAGVTSQPTGMTSTMSTSFWLTSTLPTPLETAEPGGGKSMFEEDESLMIALSVATALTLLFMALGLMFFWRRRRGRNAYYYRTVSDGYDKMPGDEAHLLGRPSSE